MVYLLYVYIYIPSQIKRVYRNLILRKSSIKDSVQIKWLPLNFLPFPTFYVLTYILRFVSNINIYMYIHFIFYALYHVYRVEITFSALRLFSSYVLCMHFNVICFTPFYIRTYNFCMFYASVSLCVSLTDISSSVLFLLLLHFSVTGISFPLFRFFSIQSTTYGT